MKKFLQLHMLTAYPPSNLNRDDLGRPKTAVVGGKTRLRISSQCLKRTWRTSDTFADGLSGSVGVRTKEMGRRLYDRLLAKGMSENTALKRAAQIAGEFGKLKKATEEDPLRGLEIEQLAFFSPNEITRMEDLVDRLAEEDRDPEEEELDMLSRTSNAVDVAMFGRMLAAKPYFNIEAAVQVAHAITVHEVAVEDDFFTAVDDLNRGEEDVGAGHMGDVEFGSGVFYQYICIDRELLVKNLEGDESLARKGLRALLEAAAKASPTGKQNSFASRAYASFILAEKGDQQPRSLSVAFLEPVKAPNPLKAAAKVLQETRERMDRVYGPCSDEVTSMDAQAGEGSLSEVLDFVES